MNHPKPDVVANCDGVTVDPGQPSQKHGASIFPQYPSLPPTTALNYTPRRLGPPSTSSRIQGTPRELLEEEWQSLKDLLHVHYIQENKTLETVRKVMREQHGLVLTQKQLTNRFSKWKFKKNVKQSEAERFIGIAETTSEHAEASVEGVRVTAAKRKRWEKRARNKSPHEGLQSSTPGQQLSPRGFNSAETNTGQNDDGLIAFGMPIDDTSVHALPSTSALSSYGIMSMSFPSTDPLRLTKPLVSDELHVSRHDVASHDALPAGAPPFSPSFEVTDQLLLSRLFATLNLGPSPDFALLHLSAPHAEKCIQDSTTISFEDLIDLSHGGGAVPWQSSQINSLNPSLAVRDASPAFKVAGLDVIFPSQKTVFAHPLDVELYPFPRHDENRFKPTSTAKYHDIIQVEMKDCLYKIQKLDSVSLGHTEAGIMLIDRLAMAYFGLGHYDEAERQFKRILPILLERHGPNSRHAVSVKRDLAETILHLGRYQEANQMAREVHASALIIDTSSGTLLQKSLHVLAQSYGNLRNLAREEELLRQLVQIRLATSGPRHGDTLGAIRSLCDSLSDSKRHSESEELLRVSLELSQNDEVSDKRKCLICRKLATVLYNQGNYRESEALYRKTVDVSVRLLGREHPDTLRCQFWLGKVLRARGSMEESHELLV
ncbi:hypothetical protein QQS21_005250 [Conoideocrella luteorostrata]|uniref:Clr5 domain-containing protein n=1 Tax=Conoideocrella luteorostrata TaxID=1105319 RepID=A0AAJ0FZ66_9HYPO|nr:hypothetical protein QQS21_005250 [Conoideocrella luteorostrata]